MVLAVLLVSSHPEQSGTLIHSAVYGHALPVRSPQSVSHTTHSTLDVAVTKALPPAQKHAADEGEDEDTVVSSERSRLHDALEAV